MSPVPLRDDREPARWRQSREFATRRDTPVNGDKGNKNKSLRQSAPVSTHVMGEERGEGQRSIMQWLQKTVAGVASTPNPLESLASSFALTTA